MRTGISTATYFGKLVTEDSFDQIRRAGVKTAEVFMNTFSEYTPEFGELLETRSRGLEIYSVHASNLNFEPNLTNPTERARADAEKIYRMVLSNGKRLGASSYTYHGGTRLKKRAYDFDFTKLGADMRRLCAVAGEYGIDLSYETVHWAYYNYPEFFGELRKHAPDLKCTLDIKQVMQSGRSYREFIPLMEGRLNNVHLTDFDDAGRILRPGKGTVDYADLFARLRDAGYDGPLMIELYCQNYESFDEVGESVSYLENILDKIK